MTWSVQASYTIALVDCRVPLCCDNNFDYSLTHWRFKLFFTRFYFPKYLLLLHLTFDFTVFFDKGHQTDRFPDFIGPSNVSSKEFSCHLISIIDFDLRVAILQNLLRLGARLYRALFLHLHTVCVLVQSLLFRSIR